jgi:hypothetical protein
MTTQLDSAIAAKAAEADEVRLDIDDNVPALALLVMADLKAGGEAYKLDRLLTSPLLRKRGETLSAKQMYQALAQIGWHYANAVEEGRKSRLRELGRTEQPPVAEASCEME